MQSDQMNNIYPCIRAMQSDQMHNIYPCMRAMQSDQMQNIYPCNLAKYEQLAALIMAIFNGQRFLQNPATLTKRIT